MKLNKQTMFGSGRGVFKFSTSSNQSDLIPGNQTYNAWPAFTNDATGDGLGLDLSGNTDDVLIGDAVPAATFLTPFMNDNADLTELAVLVHPTSYFKADGTFQEDPDVYIYANGNRKKATKTSDPNYGDLDVYKVNVSNLSGSIEFRAVVVPQFGTPAILQVKDNTWVDDGADWRLYLSGRGCVSHDYTVVNVDASSGQTLVSESSTNPATRYVVTGQSTGWSDAFSTHDIVAAPFELSDDPMDFVWPIVDGALLKMQCGATTDCRGLIYHNCDIRWWPNPATNAANRDDPGHEEWWDVGAGIQYNAPHHDTYRQTNNCVVSIPEDSSYTIGTGLDPSNGTAPAPGNRSAIQDHITRGFGALIHAYEFGANPTKIGWHPSHADGNKCRSGQYDTTFKFIVSTATETVNCTAKAVGSFNDVYNSDIIVNSSSSGLHKQLYPWASLLADADGIGYSYDYTTSGATTTGGSAVMTASTMKDAYGLDESAVTWSAVQNNNTPLPSIVSPVIGDLPDGDTLMSSSVNLGIWPDMNYGNNLYSYFNEATNKNVNYGYRTSEFMKLNDGTYLDHMGYTYTTWDKTWDAAQDPHFDWDQYYNSNDPYRRDFSVHAKNRIYGNETTTNYQGLFWNGAATLKAVAVWDHLFTYSDSDIPFSYGHNNGDPNFFDGSGSQLYGPSMAEVKSWDTPEYGGTGVSIRDFMTDRGQEVDNNNNPKPNTNVNLNQVIVDTRLDTDAGMGGGGATGIDEILADFKWTESGGTSDSVSLERTIYTRNAWEESNNKYKAEVKILKIPNS